MGYPSVTRQRRPFLAPLWVTLLGIAAALAVALLIYFSARTTVVILAAATEHGTPTLADPPLSSEGEQRADRLAQLLGDGRGPGRLSAVYVIDSRSAQQIAAQVASRLRLQPVILAGKDAADIAGRVLDEQPGQAVLLVGNSELWPQLMRELSGAVPASGAAEAGDTLYVVTIPSFGPSAVVRLRY